MMRNNKKAASKKGKSGSARPKESVGTQFKMPSKNQGFDNTDLNNLFEANIEAGDQGAPPGFDDDFAEEEILAGD